MYSHRSGAFSGFFYLRLFSLNVELPQWRVSIESEGPNPLENCLHSDQWLLLPYGGTKVSNVLQQLAVARRQSQPRGIYSVCSAHPWVLEAAFDQAVEDGSDLLIEATSNQVNHLGGYTGMLPEDFRQRVVEIAARKGFNESRLILGGDHLGPNPGRKKTQWWPCSRPSALSRSMSARGSRRFTSMPVWLSATIPSRSPERRSRPELRLPAQVPSEPAGSRSRGML